MLSANSQNSKQKAMALGDNVDTLKKMYLLSPEAFEHWQADNESDQRLSALDNDMKNVLKKKNIGDYTKWLMYRQRLVQHDNLRRERQTRNAQFFSALKQKNQHTRNKDVVKAFNLMKKRKNGPLLDADLNELETSFQAMNPNQTMQNDTVFIDANDSQQQQAGQSTPANRSFERPQVNYVQPHTDGVKYHLRSVQYVDENDEENEIFLENVIPQKTRINDDYTQLVSLNDRADEESIFIPTANIRVDHLASLATIPGVDLRTNDNSRNTSLNSINSSISEQQREKILNDAEDESLNRRRSKFRYTLERSPQGKNYFYDVKKREKVFVPSEFMDLVVDFYVSNNIDKKDYPEYFNFLINENWSKYMNYLKNLETFTPASPTETKLRPFKTPQTLKQTEREEAQQKKGRRLNFGTSDIRSEPLANVNDEMLLPTTNTVDEELLEPSSSTPRTPLRKRTKNKNSPKKNRRRSSSLSRGQPSITSHYRAVKRADNFVNNMNNTSQTGKGKIFKWEKLYK